ncbi:TetR family transcriptional regulator [Ligilactobacillus salivarius]|uniref:TetR family transcriptional regulator n=1 Tax=Ligilactobacillus salivarius TaxID=1624 RepID=UPI0009DB4AFC|nr:TetR family transcriptional regulator [Ligilactobacillus salivarius]PEH10677.1 TetR/AcrR family transcriptional regulator [Lactobacillus sp. UMNPBX2]ATP35182.1 TetR/AcrR family transcriptional regulator [Ligilactobacillus salivarius]MBM6787763.1 TetR family transcriptional regulator [Ligilactobacillus salivarius]MDM8223688.1 TetR family transcriptional regulator [Ligilactobacillus salivarius]OQR05355.1 TetR family transcriptional regulator [Ligilactobacillus salivarius]
MPKETFFGIDKEKQNRIIQAAIKVFSSHNYNDSSINEVIKLAKIPRGSFYQYFEDKRDLYLYITQKIMQNFRDDFFKELDEQNGDIFATVKIVFPKQIHEVLGGEYSNFYYYLLQASFMKDFRQKEVKSKDNSKHDWNVKQDFDVIYKMIDKEKLKIKSRSDFDMFIRILITPFIIVITDTFLQMKHESDIPKIDIEEKKQEYLHKLEFIEYGFSK